MFKFIISRNILRLKTKASKDAILLLFCMIVIALTGCSKQKITGGETIHQDTTGGEQPNSSLSNFSDIVVYGATSSGVIAAVQAKKMGKSVILISNSDNVGGITASGLSYTDIGDIRALGGMSLDFYKGIQSHYQEKGFALEPKVALETFKNYISTNNIKCFYKERLLLNGGVSKEGKVIKSIKMESGKVFYAKEFIDASYEGDLMAKSGVSYTVGREDKSKYNEKFAGWGGVMALSIDPYVIKGDPSSGLFPHVNDKYNPTGQGDDLVQSYCFRLCVSNQKDNMVSITKPEGYDSLQYQMLFRILDKNKNATELLSIAPLPHNKFDINNTYHLSIDYVGGNKGYADGDYTERANILAQHRVYEQGLLWTLQNDPRISATIRNKYSKYGLAKDEFVNNGNWPTELYVREGRRMVSDYVITEDVLFGRTEVVDPVGMASYNIDSHAVQYFIGSNRTVYVEGELFEPLPRPYGISYRAIIPKRSECQNLLVPVCLSASRVAQCSIRMEPQYMVLGQSAAIAASMSIDQNIALQDLSYSKLKDILLQNNQVVKI
ncbi:FAD-dependent oxidoreductase [Mucilaginibacter aquaedulcis]|uniref:FAD-dependent oxidoreductase n=1 Tax=Mucilaginibacter aquaedulcis TaxID=1187081 RepID=UPI0025B47A26|nr:FAD-dependent oxidoreductase [Mucilaginibacter aquaedulcis]MDN3549754.1 FAD-dependent oxidoreductase [Mucilaginibacter aquaedulcis]